MTQTTRTKANVLTAFFTAIVFLGIQAFRIPLPAAVGTPFLHFGHIFVMMAIVCLGPKRAVIAGPLGLIIFDILNGYIHAIPNIFVLTTTKCLLIGTIFVALTRKTDHSVKAEYKYAVLCSVLYGLTNTFLDFVWAIAELMILGSTFEAAFTAELTSIPATMINAVFTVVGTALLFLPVKSAYRRVMH